MKSVRERKLERGTNATQIQPPQLDPLYANDT